MMFDDPDLAGMNALSEMIENVFWKILPENDLLLRTALYQTALKYGGIDQFASICDIPIDKFYQSIKVDRIDLQLFQKVFPYIIPQLKVVFAQYMEDEAKKELKELFNKNGLDSGKELVSVINETIRDFELSEKRKKQEEIARNLTALSNYYLALHHESTKQQE